MQMKDSSKLISFMGHRQIDYSNVKVNEDIPTEIQKLDNDVIINKDVLQNDENYWQSVRPYELSEKEQNIYNMVDSIKNVPLYKNVYDIIQTALLGYYNTKYIGFGPYYKLMSFNKLEGCRFQLGVKTTSDFSKHVRLTGYGRIARKMVNLKEAEPLNIFLIINRRRSSRLVVGMMCYSWEPARMLLPRVIY